MRDYGTRKRVAAEIEEFSAWSGNGPSWPCTANDLWTHETCAHSRLHELEVHSKALTEPCVLQKFRNSNYAEMILDAA